MWILNGELWAQAHVYRNATPWYVTPCQWLEWIRYMLQQSEKQSHLSFLHTEMMCCHEKSCLPINPSNKPKKTPFSEHKREAPKSYAIYAAISLLRISRRRGKYCDGRGGSTGTPQKIRLAGMLNTRWVVWLTDSFCVCLTIFMPWPAAALRPQKTWKWRL